MPVQGQEIEPDHLHEGGFASLLPAAGFLAGTGLSKGTTVFLQKSLAPELASQLILGLIAGAVVGLLPKGLISEKGENFRNWSFWAPS